MIRPPPTPPVHANFSSGSGMEHHNNNHNHYNQQQLQLQSQLPPPGPPPVVMTPMQFPSPWRPYMMPTPVAHLAPARQPRRRTIRRVPLVEGNLVLDCPVPEQYLQAIPRRNEKEFQYMRYTAVTADPADYPHQNYKLRQELMERRTELFICITLYNENEILLARTLHGIMKNITNLCGRKRSKTWGADSWTQVVICIMADGRDKVHPRVLDFLSALGVYQEGVAKNFVNARQVHAHLYEYTTQISLNPDMKFKGAVDNIVPAQILFCLKEKNQRKINSHRWFFQAFCPKLNPNVCMLLDVGTRPGPHSIYRLWKTFDINLHVGGACGEVRAMTGPAGVSLINPLVASQNFEYKISNILDKPLESVLGYIQVLPGAFSAYRYSALQNDVNGMGPLQKYFMGEQLHSEGGIFEANMYLAEDRILCFELVAKKNAKWVLHYVSNAYGETDVPSAVPEFVTQRRRWLNGSFFAGVYALFHWCRILATDHSMLRKTLLCIEFGYLSLSWIFSWFALGNFFLCFYILTSALSTMTNPPFDSKTAENVHVGLTYVYIILLIVLFLFSMGNRPQGSKGTYTLIMLFFAGLMIYIIFASVWLAYDGIANAARTTNNLLADGSFRDILISFGATYALYFVASLLFLDPWHMITSSIQYLLMTPSYINILNTYAFCNTHDVSWGTKDIHVVAMDLGIVEGDNQQADVDMPEQKDVGLLYEEACVKLRKRERDPPNKIDPKTKQEDYYRAFRTRLVTTWILSNLILVAIITTALNMDWLGDFQTRTNGYLAFVLWSVAALAAVRFIGSLCYRAFSIFTAIKGDFNRRILFHFRFTTMALLAVRISALRALLVALSSLTSFIYAYPTTMLEVAEEPRIDIGSPEFWEKVAIVLFLVLLGGAFAGLTLGLMGLDETNLHVLIESGTPTEQKNAKQVLRLLDRGKHWVLVTLLLSNVVINETLPIILDGVFGGGWQAVVISTALIVIFGEVIPQSICVRHGLAIGAKASWMVLVLMYILYPIAYPTALLLDYFLGESHGTVYKKAGLKTLVSLHQAVNPSDVEALTSDEVTIIGAVLDLRSKPVSQIMTPISDVFTLSIDDILDEELVDKILTAGYSRIPVYSAGSKSNFIGMLLTKRLITYDPEDALPVKTLQISTLPETGPDTSCLDILNFFQEGKSHMALVSNNPGEEDGGIGVITLEDVIEELIGEEIIDETDVYVDVRNKIRVVRRQVHNSKRGPSARLQNRWAARKRHSHPYPARERQQSGEDLIRQTSNGSITNVQSHKVIEPFQKTYGAVAEARLSTSPSSHAAEESQPLLRNNNKDN